MRLRGLGFWKSQASGHWGKNGGQTSECVILKNDPQTVDVSVALFAPGEPASKEFGGLGIGQEATFDGYTIKITSICDKEVLFDLVKQPE